MSVIDKLDARWLQEGARDDAEYETFLARRNAGEPVHRILGWREFWGLRFFLSLETLEPRPDSETVIETLIKSCPMRNDVLRILDLGAGTGCLLLAALHEFPNAHGMGVDASAGAIATAQKNAAHLHLNDRAKFQQLDWNDTGALRDLTKLGGQFDVILCNPPYIPSRDIETLSIDVREHDPRAALDGGTDGLTPYRRLAPELKYLLNPGGVALFEIGHDQATDVTMIFTAQNLRAASPIQDLGGNDRVIAVKALR